MSELIKKDKVYKVWIEDISNRFRKSQLKAAVNVNQEMLKFYWTMGRDIVKMSNEAKYGSRFYNTVSSDLKAIFPEIKSFSPTNLKYMRYFYEMYPNAMICKSNSDELDYAVNRQQLADDSNLQLIFCIPWGHHMFLIDKCKGDHQKAFFYVSKIIENNWSRAVMQNQVSVNLYEREGKAITNFAQTLPETQSDLAQAITKDPYNFDFLTMQEKFTEKELKDALLNDVSKFLLELGTGFAYMGKEIRLIVGEKEKFIDLLFYNTKIHCYVVVDVKTGDFDSANAGQLGTYVVAVNHQIKTEHDNPTVGLLVCRGLDRVEAQYALESSSQPLGISSYELSKLIPEKFKGSMPTIEEIEMELMETVSNNTKNESDEKIIVG